MINSTSFVVVYVQPRKNELEHFMENREAVNSSEANMGKSECAAEAMRTNITITALQHRCPWEFKDILTCRLRPCFI